MQTSGRLFSFLCPGQPFLGLIKDLRINNESKMEAIAKNSETPIHTYAKNLKLRAIALRRGMYESLDLGTRIQVFDI